MPELDIGGKGYHPDYYGLNGVNRGNGRKIFHSDNDGNGLDLVIISQRDLHIIPD